MLFLPIIALAGTGTSALGELDLPSSALSAAMGGRSAGLVEDASAVIDNPARLGVSAGAGFAGTHTIWPVGFADSMVALYVPVSGFGWVGGQIRSLRTSLVETSEDASGSYAADGASFDYETLQVTLAVAPDMKVFNEFIPLNLRLGAAVFLARRDVADERTSGMGGTIGATADLSRSIGIYGTLRNVGRIGGAFMPVTGSVGFLGRVTEMLFVEDRLTGAFEGVWSREAGIGGGLAVEYMVRWGLIETGLRAGYTLTTAATAGNMPTVGLAVRISHLSFEIGLASLGDLGMAQVLSLSYQERRRED